MVRPLGAAAARAARRMAGLLGATRADWPGVAATAGLFLLYALRYALHPGDRVHGDGHYSWLYARSLAFDGDLHFANDYVACGDPWRKGTEEGAGRPVNPFYLGPALIWAPLLKLARALITLPPTASAESRAGCDGPWAAAALCLTPLFAALTLWMGYRLARRWCGPAAAAAGILVMGLGSTMLHFGSMNPSYSHVWSAFAVGLATLTWMRAIESPGTLRRWYAAGAAVGLAALMRMQSAVLLLAPALSLLAAAVPDVRARRFPRRTVAAGLVTLAGFASVVWIQLWVFKILYDAFFVIPYGRSYLHMGHGNPFLLLFAPNHGFFSWHPLMWLPTVGFGMMLVRRNTRTVALLLLFPIAIDVYVNSAAVWHAGASYGARRLTTLAMPFVATTAVVLAALWRWLAARPWRIKVFAATGWLLPWALLNLGGSAGNVSGRLPFARAVAGPELLGTSLRIVLDDLYTAVGNPAVLPATLMFAARYGIHPRRFDQVAAGGMFEHNYRPVTRTGPDVIRFADAQSAPLLLEGWTRAPDGMRLTAGRRARMLVELGWAYVTHVELAARPGVAVPARLTVTTRSFFGRHRSAAVVIPAGGGTVELTAPPGAFDSGINEVLLESDGDLVLTHWRWIDRSFHDTSVR